MSASWVEWGNIEACSEECEACHGICVSVGLMVVPNVLLRKKGDVLLDVVGMCGCTRWCECMGSSNNSSFCCVCLGLFLKPECV